MNFAVGRSYGATETCGSLVRATHETGDSASFAHNAHGAEAGVGDRDNSPADEQRSNRQPSKIQLGTEFMMRNTFAGNELLGLPVTLHTVWPPRQTCPAAHARNGR